MAEINKGKGVIVVLADALPWQVRVDHNDPGQSKAFFGVGHEVPIDSKRIKSLIEEADSLCACLRRILPAQVAAENKLKPKKKNPYAKYSPYSRKRVKV